MNMKLYARQRYASDEDGNDDDDDDDDDEAYH